MSNESKIEPHRITKPIQLVAAWLAGLVLVNGGFLAAAVALVDIRWVVGLLTIAAVVNVPTFLGAIFLLQTKFRPEMQEDSFYHHYLLNKSGAPIGEPREKERQNAAELVETQGKVEDPNWAARKICLNPNLSDAAKIRAGLNQAGIAEIEEFGGTLKNVPFGKRPPLVEAFKRKKSVDSSRL